MKKFGFVIVVLILGAISSASNLIAQEEQGKMIKGKIVTLVSDNFLEKKSETKYFLQRKDTTLLVPLENIGDSPPRSGQRAILSPNGRLHYSKNKTGITVNKISGKLNVVVALIQPLHEKIPWSAEKAEEYFQSSKDFFEDPRQHSKIDLSVKIVGWVKSEKTESELANSNNSSRIGRQIIDEAIGLIDDSVDFKEVDCLFIVLADGDGTWTWAWALDESGYSTNDGYCQFSNIAMGSAAFDSTSSYTISHELSHALFNQSHGAGMGTDREDKCGYRGDEVEEYEDYFDVVGSGNRSFFSALRQYRLGWLQKERVAIVSKYSSFVSIELSPREVENTDGKQLVVIEEDDEDDYFTVELYERELEIYNKDESIKSGLLLRSHGNVVNNNGYGGYDSFVFHQKDNKKESFLQPGEEICGLGEKENISIKYVSVEGEGEETIAKVEVNVEGEPEPSPPPLPSPPPPPPSPPPIPTPTPEITPTPSPYPTPTEPATGNVEKLNIYSANMAGDTLILRKGESKKVSAEALAEGAFEDIPVPNVAVKAKVVGKTKTRRIKVSPSTALTDEDGLAEFTVSAKSKGNAKIFFTAQGAKKILKVKVR